MDWILMVKESINIIAKLRNYFFKVWTFFALKITFLLNGTKPSVLANQPNITVQSGGVSRGRVSGCGCLL